MGNTTKISKLGVNGGGKCSNLNRFEKNEMDKSKIADKEIEVAKWMNKKGYDRRASKDVAPIIVEYLREFKLLNLHIVTHSAFRICEHCNKEYQLELSSTDGKYFVNNFQKCPHCKKRDDVWIKIVVEHCG